MNDAAQPAPSSPANDAPPIDTSERHLTLRSVLTGAIIGGTLALCNVYAGLKIGWGMNMSIAALLIAYGFWVAMRAVFGTRVWGMHENNVNQSGASAAASISSAGLVSAIPALTMLTGYEWDFPSLALWTFSCSILGVLTAALFRNQMIVRDKLPFAAGIAAAETLREMYAHGKEAIARLMALVGAAVAAAAFKVLALVLVIPRISILPL